MTSKNSPHQSSYHYPERFLYSEVILFLLFCTMLIFSWVPLLLAWSSSGAILQSAVKAVLFLNIAAIALLALLYRVKKRLSHIEYTVLPYALRQKSPGVHKEINFTNVTSIMLLRFPLAGGTLIVESATVTIQVPLLISCIDDLARRVISGCAEEHARFTIQPVKERLLESCFRVEANNKRSQKNFKVLFSCCFRMIPFNVVVGAFFWDMSLLPLAAWMVVGPLFPLAAYATLDGLLRRKMRQLRQSGFTGEIDALERIFALRIGIVAGCLYLASGIFFRVFFT